MTAHFTPADFFAHRHGKRSLHRHGERSPSSPSSVSRFIVRSWIRERHDGRTRAGGVRSGVPRSAVVDFRLRRERGDGDRHDDRRRSLDRRTLLPPSRSATRLQLAPHEIRHGRGESRDDRCISVLLSAFPIARHGSPQVPTKEEWLASELGAGEKFAADPKLMAADEWLALNKTLGENACRTIKNFQIP